jgi:hypothetical protein
MLIVPRFAAVASVLLGSMTDCSSFFLMDLLSLLFTILGTMAINAIGLPVLQRREDGAVVECCSRVLQYHSGSRTIKRIILKDFVRGQA